MGGGTTASSSRVPHWNDESGERINMCKKREILNTVHPEAAINRCKKREILNTAHPEFARAGGVCYSQNPTMATALKVNVVTCA